MAFEQGKAGESVQQLAKKRYYYRVLVLLIGLTMSVTILVLLRNTKVFIAPIALAIAIIPIISLIKAEKVFRKQERRALKGAKAEEIVRDILYKLRDDYAIFHDIESSYGNIDHVVINKKNFVFLIETKSHHGKVTFNGSMLLINGKPTEKNFIKQTLNNTYWLKEEIKRQNGMNLYINSIIVFTNALVDVPNPVKGISVINKKDLVNVLTQDVAGKKYEEKFSTAGLFSVILRLQRPAQTESDPAPKKILDLSLS